MLDPVTGSLAAPLLKRLARWLAAHSCHPDQVTVAGFLVGALAVVAIVCGWYLTGLVLILLSRFADGLDGALARITAPSDAGGFLDITLDFLFYGGVVLGFALAEPGRNGLPAATLLFTFFGTGGSFLAFAIMAERRQLTSITYPHKGLYYLGGLAEGTETVLFLVICCLFPSSFPLFAYLFSAVCVVTALTRIIGGYRNLQ